MRVLQLANSHKTSYVTIKLIRDTLYLGVPPYLKTSYVTIKRTIFKTKKSKHKI